MISNEKIEDFIGFYAGRHFWIDKILDWNSDEAARRLRGFTAEVGYTRSASSYKAAVTIDGLILLHIDKLIDTRPDMSNPAERDRAVLWWDEYLDQIHALQVIFETTSMRVGHPLHNICVAELIPTDTCTIGMFDWDAVRGNYDDGRSILSDRIAARYWLDGKDDKLTPKEVIEPFSFNYATLSTSDLDEIFSNFETLTAFPIKIRWFSFIAKCKTAFGRGDHRVSFMLAWFVVESACKDSYHSLAATVGKAGAAMNTKVSMHDAVKELFAKGVINQSTVDTIDSLRTVRNDLVHQPHVAVCSQADCISAYDVARTLACEKLGFNINLRFEHSVKF